MTPQRRRIWLTAGLVAVTAAGLGVAWWVRPVAPDPESLLTPVPGSVRAPPLPPPNQNDDPDIQHHTEGSDASDDSDEPAELGAGLEPDDELPPGFVGRTPDGAPVRGLSRKGGLVPVGAMAPGGGTVQRLALGAGGLLAEISTPTGSLVLLWGGEAQGGFSVVELAGWPTQSAATARPRHPTWSDAGGFLLAQTPTGQDVVWAVDLTEATATPLVATGWPLGSRASGLVGAGTSLVAVSESSSLLLNDENGWRPVALGAAGLKTASVSAGPQVVFSRLGRIFLWSANRTVPDPIAFGSEPVRVNGATAFVREGLVWVLPDGGQAVSAGALLPMPGPDVVTFEGGFAWVRPDGRLGVIGVGGEPRAVDVRLEPINALAGHEDSVVLAGQDGAVQTVEFVSVSEALAPL